jgi:GTPase SAR1 family protein
MTTNTALEPSLFKTRGPLDPVNDRAIYVPRPELDKLLRAAQATSVDAYLAILSSRQTGKTTLLYQLRHRLRPRGVGVALIDLAVVHDQSEERLYSYVARQLRSEFSANLPRGAEKKDIPLPTNSIEFRRFLLDLARQVRAPRLVVLMDEVEAVPEGVSDGFFGTWRSVFSSRRKEDEIAFEKYLLVLCGARELHRLTSGPNSPLNIAERIYLKDFDVNGVQVLVANFPRVGIGITPETAQSIYEYTGGHPYLTQKMCALIHATHPDVVTPPVVRAAAEEILRSDDHLEKMLLQIEAEPPVREQLEQIVAGQSVPFSRLNPTVARLELLGAIRDEKQCIVRNALFAAAFRNRFGIPETPPPPPPQPKPWGRWVLAFVAILIFLVNLPFLTVYTSDILLAPRSVNVPVVLGDVGARAIIRYDPILRANSSEPNVISVEIESSRPTPISVTLYKGTDIVLDGSAQREFKPPTTSDKFAITLYQHGADVFFQHLLNPSPQRRQVVLEFTPPGHRQALDFRVDFYSGFVISLGLTMASVVTFIVGVLRNVQQVRELLDRLLKPARTT